MAGIRFTGFISVKCKSEVNPSRTSTLCVIAVLWSGHRHVYGMALQWVRK